MTKKSRRHKIRSGPGRSSGTVRIIGGKWRGTRLPVADIPGLRPSGDRSRETLFNWLQHDLRGAHCLDLFAGSGALGLEAASRGAASVVLIENEQAACDGIHSTIEKLGAEQIHLIRTDAIAWLHDCEAGQFNVVFIDPPFGSGLDERAVSLIKSRSLMREEGWIYLERARNEPRLNPPAGWNIHREKELGDVFMTLWKNF